MSDATRDRVEGTLDDAKGRGKMAIGDLTDNERLQEEGAADRASGGLKKAGAGIKDKVGDIVDRVTGNDGDR